MALDFDTLRKKLNTLQGQNDRKSALWKPPAGTSQVRIVPWKGDPTNPFIELYFHYLGRKTQLSPLTNGQPDPIAEFADKLASTNDSDDWKFSRQFTPKRRTYVPVIVRGEEDKGVRLWGFGKQVYETLLAIIGDSDYGDITDVETGTDIGVEFIPEKESDTAFAQTKIMVKRHESQLSDVATTVETWLTEQPDVDEVFVAPSYDELASFLERHLNPEGDTSETAAAKAPVKKTEVAPAVAVVTPEVDDEGASDPTDVAKEFETLFNS